ncbi:MAG TPA: serine hydrolase [Caulobacteraceae bacterium]|jgi:CubicO group peptidase (beta-lactamase class C family)
MAETWSLPADARIAEMLRRRIDAEKDGVGIAVGVIDANGARFVSHGRTRRGSRKLVDADNVFEIGSITKVFTSLLLSDMVLRGETALDEPVRQLLGPDAVAPTRRGREITLNDLATHTSGLPRMPGNFAPADPTNPYVDYGPEQLLAFLASHQLTRDIGERFEYSNYGAGLLGYALSLRAGSDYETLVRERITTPLGMTDTAMTLPPALRRRLASGHGMDLRPVANWDLWAMAGAGALRSTASDMAKFLAAVLGHVDAPISAAMRAQRAAPSVDAGQPGVTIGLGWLTTTPASGDVTVWHNGGTGGYRAYAGVNLARGFGAVVLTNAATMRGGDDIGVHLLAGRPLAPRPKTPKVIAVPTEVLDRYVGLYRYSPSVSIEITRQGERLIADVTDIGASPVLAIAPTRFVWPFTNTALTFETSANGRVGALTTQREGQEPRRAIREA